jgi:RNA polymerase sigma factor (sigma-70 family)
MDSSQLGRAVGELRCALLTREEGLSDAGLLELFVATRDDSAFAALVRRHGPMVLGVCRRVLNNAADADDAFQATFLVLARRAAAVAPRERVGCFLYGVACRAALAVRSARARRRARERQAEVAPHPATTPDDGPPELLARLDEELNRLPEKYRAAVVLCELEGRPRKDAAHALGLPEGTLSSRLAAARRLLARRLRRHLPAVTAGTLAEALAGQAAAVPAPPVGAAGPASGRATALADGLLRAALLAKVKAALVAVLLVVGVVAAGLVAFTPGGPTGAELPGRPGPDEIDEPSAEVARWMVPGGRPPNVCDPILFTPDGKVLITGVAAFSTPRLWDVPSGKLRLTLPRDTQHLVLSPDGALLAAGQDFADSTSEVVLWDIAANKERARIRIAPSSTIEALAFSPDGKALAVVAATGRAAEVFDTATGAKRPYRLELSDTTRGVAFSPDGKALLALSRTELARWDVLTGRALERHEDLPDVPEGPRGAVVFSPDARTVVAARVGEVRFWDVAARKDIALAAAAHAAGSGPTLPRFSADGKLVATARARDRTVKVWETTTGKLLATLAGDPARPGCLAFSPDGKLLAVSDGEKGAVRLWEIVGWREAASLPGAALGLAFGPDGKTLAALYAADGKDREVRLWDVLRALRARK